MMSEPTKVIRGDGMIGLEMGSSFKRLYWYSPLDALDLADELAQMAEVVGAEVVADAKRARKMAS
jgi:hypothetical protein